jgi:hypothetical protein
MWRLPRLRASTGQDSARHDLLQIPLACGIFHSGVIVPVDMPTTPAHCREERMHMPGPLEPLTTASVLATVVPLLQREKTTHNPGPRCTWCHGLAVWTTGNKVRCTVCGYVPS